MILLSRNSSCLFFSHFKLEVVEGKEKEKGKKMRINAFLFHAKS